MGAKPGSRKGFAFRGALGRREDPVSPPSSGRKPRWPWALASLAVLTGAYLYFQDRIVDANLRPLIQQKLSEVIQSPVTLGSVRAGWTGHVLLNDLSMTVPGYPWESKVRVQQVSLDLALWDLAVRHRPIEECLQSLTLLRPEITLTRSSHSQAPVTALSGSSPALAAPIPVIPAGQVAIKSGSFSIQNGKEPRLVFRDLDFRARSVGHGTWGLSLQAFSPEKQDPGSLRFNGSFHLDPQAPGTKGMLKLDHWPLATLGPALKGTTGWDVTQGFVSIQTPLVFQAGKPLWFDGHADLADADLKTPGPLVLTFNGITGRANLRPTEVKILDELSFNLGATPWKATGLIPMDGRPLAARAVSDHLAASTILEDLLKVKAGKVEGSTGSANLLVSGALADPSVSGSARLGPTTVAGWPLESLSVHGKFEQQTLKFDSISGKLMGGSLSGNGFISLADQPDAPVSLSGRLVDLDAGQAAGILGISQTQGRINADIRYYGPRDRTTLSSTSQLEIFRTLRNTPFHYSIRNNVQWKDNRMQVTAILNEKSKLEAVFTEGPDAWTLERFLAVADKRSIRLTGSGVWPKSQDQPIQLEVGGKGIPLEGLPFFSDQFPEVEGKVDLSIKVGGTRREIAATAKLDSEKVSLKGQEPGPMRVALTYRPGEILFDRLEIGENGDKFSVSGRVGLDPQAPMDLSIKANDVPLQTIAEIGGWNNPPQPFEGSVKGQLHLTGTKKNPLLQGDDIRVAGLKVGDWHAEDLEASLKMDGGKLMVRRLLLDQKGGSLNITGTWDTQAHPGAMAMKFDAKGFQLGMGPSLTGVFVWNAQITGDPFWKAWTGTFASQDFSLTDLNQKTYRFTDLGLTADMADSRLKGKVHLGGAIQGTTELDLAGETPQLQAQLRFEPVPFEQLPEVNQFLPAGLKITGKFSGDLKLEKGPWATLPLSGSLQLVQGKVQNYDFDHIGFQFNGDKKKLQATATLQRDLAKYNLEGSLESPLAVWDPTAALSVHGPVEKEKLRNLLALLGIDTDQKRVGGEVNGELSVKGPLNKLGIGFSLSGKDLRYQSTLIPSADLHFTESGNKITLGKNRIELEKGTIRIGEGSLELDPEDPTLVLMSMKAETKDVPLGPFHLTSSLQMTGKASLGAKAGRPDFEGNLSLLEQGNDPKQQPKPFDLSVRVKDKVVDFLPLEAGKAQLVGEVDLSQDQKVAFKDLRLLNYAGVFTVDGNLDLGGGACHLVSDAKDVPIQEIAKWVFPNFPFLGMANYHLVLDGTLENPLFTTSLSLSQGRIGDLDFDLLDGVLRSKDNTLYLGDDQNPISLNRGGKFNFTVRGKMPIALTKDSWLKVQNRNMDIDAKMNKGDFSLILLGGLAKKASGAMDFSAHVGGTLDNPDLTMDLDLNNCQMVPGMVAERIEDISGRIKVRHNTLAVDSLNGRIGQGRVFISSPPIEQSKMKLVNFVPQYFDFRVQTVGEHGVWLSIPTIMRPGEWGEILFYGATPNDPLVISGPLEHLVVSGTALLQSGHFTFPPIQALDENGKPIEYRELAGVTFDLKLVSGKNTWYSNDFNTNYLELQVDPGNAIKIEGRDSDSTPDEAGIKCYGTASTTRGWLWYLNHKFTMESGWVQLSKGAKPFIKGRAVDHWHNVEVITAGGVRNTDVDIWVNLSGTFGKIDFNLESSPPFDPTDPDKQQKLLLSYIMFGKDMTGYTAQALQQAYEHDYGQAAKSAVFDAINRMALNEASRAAREYTQKWLGSDVQFKGQPLAAGPGSAATPVAGGPEATGNSLVANSSPFLQMELTKPLDPKLSLKTQVGFNRGVTGDLSPTGSMGLQYDFTSKLHGDISYGSNDLNQQEARASFMFTEPLPDIKVAKKDDKEKPNFERFDVYPVGPGKYSVLWTTDKVTKNTLSVLDGDGNEVQVKVENKDFEYRHEMVIDGLTPDADYDFRITAKDLNGNTRSVIKRVTASNQ
ncbi:MAG TPA: translocation/assembly module TamB domain-containing protein [bacterium]|nr:translocation/assembly module TamB domain-containing protein [bacterium]